MENTSFLTGSFFLPSCTLLPLKESAASEIGSVLVTMEPWYTLGYTGEAIYRYFTRDDPALFRYVVGISGEIVGLICIRYPWLIGPFIELVAIWDKYQGKGLGREIMGWLENQSTPISKNIWATVSSFNEKARFFYKGLGFEEVADLADLVKPACIEILLRKRLQ